VPFLAPDDTYGLRLVPSPDYANGVLWRIRAEIGC
jgi:hypothetical protein